VVFNTPYLLRPANTLVRVLDIQGASRAAGAPLILWDTHKKDNQYFVFESAGDGSVFIRSYSSGLYLDIHGASKTRGASVIQWGLHRGANQRWLLTGSLAEGLTVVSALAPDLVLDIYGASSANGARLITWNPTGGANQRFYPISAQDASTNPRATLPEGDGIYLIATALDSQKVLDIAGGSPASGMQPALWTTNRRPWQLFSFTRDDEGYYRIMPLSSNRPLGTAEGSIAAGAAVLTQDDTGADSQRFALEGDLAVGYVLRSKASGLVFDIQGASSANGAPLLLWTMTGKANQRFFPQKQSDETLVSSFNAMLKDGYYRIFTSSGLTLSVAGDVQANGANIELGTPDGSDPQKWLADVPSAGRFAIRNAVSGRVLDIEGAQVQDGANILQWSPHGGDNQLWTLEHAGGGFFYAKSVLGTYLAAAEQHSAGSNVYSSLGVADALCFRFEKTSFTAASITINQDIRSAFAHGYKGPEHTKYIMLHDTEGTGGPQNVINWWARPGNGVAAHFIVGRDGSVWQCVPLNQIAWHAGYGSPGKAALFNVYNDGRDEAGNIPSTSTRSYGMNSWSIGIEMVHVGGGAAYTVEQLNALDSLIAYLDRFYGFEATIIDHKAWAVSNSDTSPEFAPYLSNYQRYRRH
jgi:hypothetical protein